MKAATADVRAGVARGKEANMRWGAVALVAASMAAGCSSSHPGSLWQDECGGACGAGQVCWAGYCYDEAGCTAPYSVCAYSDGTQGCTDLDNDPYNCGGCGVYCEGVCARGACEAAGYLCSDVGLAACDGYCADTTADPYNCGACGVVCSPGQPCASGGCSGGACSWGLTECATGCANLMMDPLNCGTCGQWCPDATPLCSAGACVAACPTGATTCGGGCTAAAGDPLNCYNCGEACGDVHPFCLAENGGRGICVDACPADKLTCGYGCVDPRTNPYHCGGCDQVCPGTCTDGVCH